MSIDVSVAGAGQPGPLVLTGDLALGEEVRSLAAALGVATQAVSDPGSTRPLWARAPLVLVGADSADALAALGLPRREAVHLVTAGPVPPQAWQAALAIGAETVQSLPEGRAAVADLLATCGEEGGAEGVVVCVTAGCGGAGASVFAAALAARASPERSVLLVDADPWGGGIDLLVGGEDVSGLRWPDLAATTGRVPAASLREVVPVVDGVAVLSWSRDEPQPLTAATMRTVLAAARRGHDLVVVDLARGADDAVQAALAAATRTVVVVPALVRAVAAARVRMPLLLRSTTDLRVLVRGARTGGVGADDVAASLGVPLLAEMGAERGLAEWLDRGFGPLRNGRGPLARACSAALAGLELPAVRAA